MKKTYEKPELVKRERLSAVTALGPGPSVPPVLKE
ncbi:putative RiPP precursor [Mesorhizobium sp. B2-3-12]|nr:putative RiPP precursor [Mesorhizobium sp. B2-3-12]